MQTNILQYLEQTAARVPDNPAITSQEESLTFRELQTLAGSIGSCLLGHGVTKAPVVVLMPKSPRTIAAFLGAIYAGCYYVPLDTQMPRSRIDRILRQLDPGILLCDRSTQSLARELNFLGPVIEWDRAASYPVDQAGLWGVRGRQLDIDPIYIVFTSGSTGDPKGVVGSHRAVIDYIEAFCEVMDFDETTLFGNQTPLYFDACLKEVIPALKYGAQVHLIPRQLFLSPLRLVEYLNERRINTLCWVVSALTMISSFQTFEKAKPEHLRTVAFASEVFPVRQLNLWRRTLPNTRFLNLYGPTETTGICCYYEVDREFEERESLPIGQPLHNTEILLLDEDGLPGNRGEICIRGTRLTLGYYRDMARTRERFTQNPLHNLYPESIYHTGDLGARNDRGELVFLGRLDNQIKHMGHRIELGELEAAALCLEGVYSACCVYTQGVLRLFYTGTASHEALSSHLRRQLPRYMLPQVLQPLDAMPLTPNGKLDRTALKQGLYGTENE